MLDNKIFQYFKDNIKLLNASFDRKELDILIRYTFDNKNNSYIDEIYYDDY